MTKIYFQIFFVCIVSGFPKVHLLSPYFQSFFLLWAQKYLNIYLKFCLKYIQVFVYEDEDEDVILSNIFAYLFDEILDF